MKELYEESFSVAVSPVAKDWEQGDAIRAEIERVRDELVEQLKVEGADPRHYKWTIYESPPQEHSLSYHFRMTAERLPDYVIAAYRSEKELEA